MMGRGCGQSSGRLTLESKLVLPCWRALNQQAFYIPILFPLLRLPSEDTQLSFIFIFFPTSLEWFHLDFSQIRKNMDFLFKEWRCVRTVPFYKSPMSVLKGKPKGLPKHFKLSFSGAALLRCHCSKSQQQVVELVHVGVGLPNLRLIDISLFLIWMQQEKESLSAS